MAVKFDGDVVVGADTRQTGGKSLHFRLSLTETSLDHEQCLLLLLFTVCHCHPESVTDIQTVSDLIKYHINSLRVLTHSLQTDDMVALVSSGHRLDSISDHSERHHENSDGLDQEWTQALI